MKKTLILGLPLLFLASAEAGLAEQETEPAQPQEVQLSAEELQAGMKQVFGELMSVMGAMTTGMAEGMRQGAETMQSELDALDGSRVIASADELKKLATVRVHKVEEKDGKWLITLAVKNEHDFPLRLTELNREQQVLLLDEEGFAHRPEAGHDRSCSVPARASVKLSFLFSGLDSSPKTFRLYGLDFSVSGAPVSDSL